ncbi:microfibril-associated glycoprotein 4-like isoform 2-T2 [Cochliomyia hominivorax]
MSSSAMNDIEQMYLNFFTQIESVKKSIEILKVRMDVLGDRNQITNHCAIDKQFSSLVFENFDNLKKMLNDMKKGNSNNTNSPYLELESKINIIKNEQENSSITNGLLSKKVHELEASEKSLKEKYENLEAKFDEILKKYTTTKTENDDLKIKVSDLNSRIEEIKRYHSEPIFDVRGDMLPTFKEFCREDQNPVDCKAATKCTQKSGYYRIYLPHDKTKEIMVFCDTETRGGDWLHILRRKDGSENFTRPWLDYVNGFGAVDGEYWLGLENMHQLTNKIGQQQLYVHIEDFEGNTYYALYDDFVVGNATESYALKSLGKYYGMGEDDMSYNVGSKFSTIDQDNDDWGNGSCATERQTGWWYTYCTYVQPTGHYLRGESSRNAMLWRSFHGLGYSHKVMYLMIRTK